MIVAVKVKGICAVVFNYKKGFYLNSSKKKKKKKLIMILDAVKQGGHIPAPLLPSYVNIKD